MLLLKTAHMHSQSANCSNTLKPGILSFKGNKVREWVVIAGELREFKYMIHVLSAM